MLPAKPVATASQATSSHSYFCLCLLIVNCLLLAGGPRVRGKAGKRGTDGKKAKGRKGCQREEGSRNWSKRDRGVRVCVCVRGSRMRPRPSEPSCWRIVLRNAQTEEKPPSLPPPGQHPWFTATPPSLHPPERRPLLSDPPLAPQTLEFTSLVTAYTSTTHQEAPASKRVPIFSHPTSLYPSR